MVFGSACVCGAGRFVLRIVIQLNGLCTSAAVGVGVVTCCVDIGFRHMFLALGCRKWCMVGSADIISTDRVGGGPDWWLLLLGKALSLVCLGGAVVGGGNIIFGVHIICRYLLCNLYYLLIQDVSHNS